MAPILISDGVSDWLETAAITRICGASCQPDYQRHLRLEANKIPSSAYRGLHPNPAIDSDGDVHEDVERDWDHVRFDAVGRQRIRQISEAPAMKGLIRVKVAEGRFAAWS